LIYVTPEGGSTRAPGLHLYPWHERRYSIGWRLTLRSKSTYYRWYVRWGRFAFYNEWAKFDRASVDSQPSPDITITNMDGAN
jgi:hypothetical protein